MSQQQPGSGLVTLLYIIYGLHFFSALNGVLTPAFIATAFLTGWPSIVAVILSYIKRDEAAGTYLESHFAWVIQTFWYAAGAVAISIVLMITIIGIPIAFVIIVFTGLWVLYRILKGIFCLLDEKPVDINP